MTPTERPGFEDFEKDHTEPQFNDKGEQLSCVSLAISNDGKALILLMPFERAMPTHNPSGTACYAFPFTITVAKAITKGLLDTIQAMESGEMPPSGSVTIPD